MVSHTDKRFNALGMAIDVFFRSTVPIVWLIIVFFALFWINLRGVQIAMVVIPLLWLGFAIYQITSLVKRHFFKKEDNTK
jgi:hypothetical protein